MWVYITQFWLYILQFWKDKSQNCEIKKSQLPFIYFFIYDNITLYTFQAKVIFARIFIHIHTYIHIYIYIYNIYIYIYKKSKIYIFFLQIRNNAYRFGMTRSCTNKDRIEIIWLNYPFNDLVLHLNNGHDFGPQLAECNFLLGSNSLMKWGPRCFLWLIYRPMIFLAWCLWLTDCSQPRGSVLIELFLCAWVRVCIVVCCQMQNEVIILL